MSYFSAWYTSGMSHLDELNTMQKKAATHKEGPLLVVAGAGTGKTKTIVHRIFNLIQSGVDPRAILAITFTNKAAKEMRERVAKHLPHEDGRPLISTFHSLGVRILREQYQIIGLPRYFNILDSQDTTSLIKQAMKELDIDTKLWEPRKISSIISRAKGDHKKPETFEVNANPITAITKSVWARYETLKREEKSLDFADLLSETYTLLQKNKDILAHYQKRFQYIHVDEYQDTNTIQYKIVKLLAASHHNVCAVGDGDQNIYSWRGADMKNILNFEKDFPGATVVLLEQNYRSTANILQVAHEVISKNTQRIDKKLIANKDTGERVRLYEAFSAHQEASWVADQVQEYLKSGVEAGDIAVLFRTNFQSRILEEAFLTRTLPYQVVGVKFFSRKEVKDLIAYLKAALNPASLTDLKRIINEPKRGLGKVAVAKIFANRQGELSGKAASSYQSFSELLARIASYAQDHAPSETLRYIIKESGFQEKLSQGSDDDKERLDNLKELVSYATKYDDHDQSLEQFLEEIALLSDQDSLGSNSKDDNSVKLMTVHASKGLEFQHVFVVGLEQGLFPSQRDGEQSKHEQEEERRLCYVAFTRAKEFLHLSYAQLRTIYGQQRINEPSEFIRDISEDLLDCVDYSSSDEEDSPQTFYLDF